MGGPRPIFYGWWVLTASVAAMAVGSGTSFWSFGLYIEPLENQFGWSRAEVSLGFSASLLVSGLSGPLVGRWVDERGARQVILIGASMTAATYLLLATTSALWQWYLYLSINAVFRHMMFLIPFQALISRWFQRKRSLALGILGTGFSLGGLVVVPIIRAVMDSVGWEWSFVFSGALVLAVFVPLGLLVIRNYPSDVGTYPDGKPLKGENADSGPRVVDGLRLGQALRTPIFWALAGGFMFFYFSLFGWLVHQVPFYESTGISRTSAANIVALAAGLGALSRLSFGLLMDWFGRVETAAVVLATFLMGSMLTLLISTSPVAIGIFLAFWAIGAGGGSLLEPLLLPRAFGLAHFGSILGAIGLVQTLGRVSSPVIAGAIYDETGSYTAVLVMFLAAFGGTAACFWMAARMRRPYAESAEPRTAYSG